MWLLAGPRSDDPRWSTVWEVASGKLIGRTEAEPLIGLTALSPDGAWLAVSRRTGITLWDVTKGQKKWAIDLPVAMPFCRWGLEFDPSGKTVLLGNSAGMIQGYSVEEGKPVGPLVRTHGAGV